MATTVSFTVPIRQLSPLHLARRDLVINAGEDTDIQFTIKETDGGSAVDITGATINFRMTRPHSMTIELEKAGSIVTAASGIGKVAIEDTDTIEFAGPYDFDLRVTLTSRIFTSMRGTIIVSHRLGETVEGFEHLIRDYS